MHTLVGVDRGAIATTAGLALMARELAADTVDVVTAPDSMLVSAVRDLEIAQRALDSARFALVGELEARGEPERRRGLRAAGWLSHELLWPRPAAGRCVGTARKLRSVLPLVADALRDGRITAAHAELLARLCHDRVEPIVVDLQERLIDLAVDVRYEQWAREVRALIDLADVDGPEPGPERNHVAMADGLSGELHMDITLVGADAASVRASMLAELERRYRLHRRLANQNPDHLTPSRSQLLAEGFAELMRRGFAAGVRTKAPVTDVTLVVQASDPVHATTPDGVPLQDRTTRLLLCDAAVTPVIVDRLGRPLDMGTAARFYTPDQRRVIRLRDGGCIFPAAMRPSGGPRSIISNTQPRTAGPTSRSDTPSARSITPRCTTTGAWSPTPPTTPAWCSSHPPGSDSPRNATAGRAPAELARPTHRHPDSPSH